MTRIILGIDPGLAHLGWAVLANGQCVGGGVFRTKCTPKDEREAAGISKSTDKMRRAHELGRFLAETIETFRVDTVAHEAISLGFHQSTTLFDMGLAFGVIGGACASGVSVIEVKPGEIKAWARPHHPKGVSKTDVIAAVRAAYPGIAWPRATLTHEHLADAVAAADVARRRAIATLVGQVAG